MSDTRISEKALRAFMERAYEKEGFEAEEARQIADVRICSASRATARSG